MRCRRVKEIVNKSGTKSSSVVWFGSYGINQDGSAKFYDSKNHHDNFSDGNQAIADSLTQRLSVIKNELWYDMNAGLPLIDKLTSKSTMDAFVINTISRHPDIESILSFSSSMKNRVYTCSIEIQSKFGVLSISM